MGWGASVVSKCEQGERLLEYIEGVHLCHIFALDISLLICLCCGSFRRSKDGKGRWNDLLMAPEPAAGIKPYPVTGEERQKLCALLTSRRQTLQISQRQLAQRAGFLHTCISKCETGNRRLGFWEMVTLCDYLLSDIVRISQAFLPAASAANLSLGTGIC